MDVGAAVVCADWLALGSMWEALTELNVKRVFELKERYLGDCNKKILYSHIYRPVYPHARNGEPQN
jgi:hypothetical protein